MYQQRVRELYDQLSPGYRRIAQYVLEHYRDAAFMTAAELARSTSVDTTSVVRFAQRLGYAGYPELIADIQGRVKRDLREMYEPPPEARDAGSVFWSSLLEDRNNLDTLLRENDPAEIEKVVELLCDAQRIMVAGEAASNFVAEIMAQRLTSLGLSAWNSGADMLGRISLSIQLQPGDVVVGLAPTNAAAGIAVVLEIAREIGVHTVAVIGTDTNRAALVADHVIYAPSRTVGLFYSPAPAMAVVHAIGQAVSLRRADNSAEWALRGERLVRRYIQSMRSQPSITLAEVIGETNAGVHPKSGSEDNASMPAVPDQPVARPDLAESSSAGAGNLSSSPSDGDNDPSPGATCAD